MKIENNLCRTCFGAGKCRGEHCSDCNGTGIASDPRAVRLAFLLWLVLMAIIVTAVVRCAGV